jgi:formylglycine-generating enzyme required for sulfatase activity
MREHDPEPVAVSQPGVVPNGYLSGLIAARACENAGKRLCRADEWRLACEGQAKRPFPYGVTYREGACNIFREAHPGAVLHGNASIGLQDPRMNLVLGKDGDPLLRVTGGTEGCKSVWGDEVAYDMNGNLDEWVVDTERGPDPETGGWRGRMSGGFFSRAKRDGCASNVIVHPKTYLDYSTGTRCCSSP